MCDMTKSPKALLRDLSKVLLESSRVLQEAQRNYGSSVNDANESIIVDDDGGELTLQWFTVVQSPVLKDVLEGANEVQKSMKLKGRKKKGKDDKEVLVSKSAFMYIFCLLKLLNPIMHESNFKKPGVCCWARVHQV